MTAGRFDRAFAKCMRNVVFVWIQQDQQTESGFDIVLRKYIDHGLDRFKLLVFWKLCARLDAEEERKEFLLMIVKTRNGASSVVCRATIIRIHHDPRLVQVRKEVFREHVRFDVAKLVSAKLDKANGRLARF